MRYHFTSICQNFVNGWWRRVATIQFCVYFCSFILINVKLININVVATQNHFQVYFKTLNQVHINASDSRRAFRVRKESPWRVIVILVTKSCFGNFYQEFFTIFLCFFDNFFSPEEHACQLPNGLLLDKGDKDFGKCAFSSIFFSLN